MSFTNPPNVNNPYLSPVIQIPSALSITAISQSNPMVVTTSANSDQTNTYIPGQTVKLNVPKAYGMWQANGLTGTIIAINGNQLSLNINSARYDPFVIPSGSAAIGASLGPSGSRNLQYNNNTNQVGFQSLNNQGN